MVFVTGGEGFIGSHLMNKLKSENIECKSYDIENGFDILDFERLCSELDGFDKVVHLAAEVSVQKSVEDPKRTFKTNIEGTWNVLEACRLKGVKTIVFASSAAVYGDIDKDKLDEGEVRPISPYGMSKTIGEDLALIRVTPSIACMFSLCAIMCYNVRNSIITAVRYARGRELYVTYRMVHCRRSSNILEGIETNDI